MADKNSLSSPFRGILDEDSPSSKVLILRYLGIQAFELLSASYEISVKNGALVESGVKRTPSARFNPRPARIIHILLAEAGCRDMLLVNDAVVASAEAENCSLIDLLKLEKQDFVDCPYLSAFVLDQLRHLHMSEKLSHPQLRDVLFALQKLYELDSFSYWPKLNSLISHSLQRTKSNIIDRS